jgi:hypothetical protein
MAQLKRDRLKGSDVSAETAARQHRRRLQPGAQGAGVQADALDKSGNVDTAKLKKNRRERLGVGPDHKPPLMQKRRRGSFP